MADGQDSPLLKRKREGAEPLRKKVKTKANGTNGANGASPHTPDTPPLSRTDRKKAAREKARQAEAEEEEAGRQLAAEAAGATADAPAIVKQQRQQRSAKAKEKGKNGKNGRNGWAWSEPLGGWFLPADPVFASDERHLLLANARALHVYAADSSTLVRSLSKRSSFISAYALSAADSNRVYTASEAGLITLADWTDGSTVGRWDIGSNVRCIKVVRDPASNMDLVYSHEAVGSSHVVNVHALRTREQDAPTELKQILKRKAPISGMQVLLHGKIVVVAIHKSILIGRRSKLQKTALQDYEYVWREFQTAKRVTGFDAYVRTPDASLADHIDLAVGDQDGVIWLFEDVLSSFARVEKTRKEAAKPETDLEMLRPKRLHWHREAVASVKWSRDGNYLISGGAETVLVLWQLSTGKQQHLPHLTAAIENIVLSPTGASYAVTLANNSVLVLSTTELDAKMNVIGVQSRRVDMEQFPREARPSSYSSDLFTHVPMVVDPKSPGHVLFPAPSSQPRHEKAGFRPQPYLQTFDIAHQHTVGRQALTRNNATDPNMAPDGRRIEEPNVTLVQVSSDGKWLATVDEWIPPRDDIAYLDEGIAEFNEEERSFRREIYLKFWQWDEKSAQWALESRIDAPHFFEGQGASARILDLVADPAGAAFATVGEDRSVRIWRPKTRTRGGVTVRGADKGEGLVTWSLHRSISLNCSLDSLEPNHGDLASKVPQRARMAFSADGSVLAAGIADVAAGVIHIIDAIGGSIKRSITELDAALLSHLGILGRHMIVVGPSIIVWDLVTDELVHCIPYGSWDSDRFDGSPLVRLAVNAESGTFAVALPHFEADNSAKSRNPQRFLKAFSTVSVFDPHHSRAIFESRLPNYTLALVPAKNGKGYITLDSNSTIQVLSPDAGPLQLPTAPEQASELLPESHREDEPVDETETAGDAIGQHLADNDFLYSENDKPVVRPEDLQHVFDAGPSHALLPVKDLFNAVVGLYARKPRAGVVA